MTNDNISDVFVNPELREFFNKEYGIDDRHLELCYKYNITNLKELTNKLHEIKEFDETTRARIKAYLYRRNSSQLLKKQSFDKIQKLSERKLPINQKQSETELSINQKQSETESPINQKHVNIVICGNMGSGKSTLVNTLCQRHVADSGPSFGNGMTVSKKSVPLSEGVMVTDTPGLDDLEDRSGCAKQITEALLLTSRLKLVFLVATEHGRVRPSDITTVNEITACLDLDFVSYAVIINRVPSDFGEAAQESVKQTMLQFLTKKESHFKPEVLFIPTNSDLEGKKSKNKWHSEKICNEITLLVSSLREMDTTRGKIRPVPDIENKELVEEVNRLQLALLEKSGKSKENSVEKKSKCMSSQEPFEQELSKEGLPPPLPPKDVDTRSKNKVIIPPRDNVGGLGKKADVKGGSAKDDVGPRQTKRSDKKVTAASLELTLDENLGNSAKKPWGEYKQGGLNSIPPDVKSSFKPSTSNTLVTRRKEYQLPPLSDDFRGVQEYHLPPLNDIFRGTQSMDIQRPRFTQTFRRGKKSGWNKQPEQSTDMTNQRDEHRIVPDPKSNQIHDSRGYFSMDGERLDPSTRKAKKGLFHKLRRFFQV